MCRWLGRAVVTLTVLFTLALSKSTIDDTNQLFWNTINKWNVQIKDKQDLKERYNRLVKAKASVEGTTSGIVLTSLNRFAVNNDAEQAALINGAQSFNISEPTEGPDELNDEKPPVVGSILSSGPLPEEYEYWEKELGMSEPQDQASCGSCWSFPNAAALEAVYRQLTGEFVVFSKQYFIDCTFSYSGCAGGRVLDGYRVTKDRQFLLSEESWPTTVNYKPCKFKDQIASGEDNAMRKAWLQDWYPLGQSEHSMLSGLQQSPVAFGSYISENYFAYSSGLYDDASCATETLSHSQLLVGYTKHYLRVRGSFGIAWGDWGYINYKRGSPNLLSCRFYSDAVAIKMTHRRDIEYRFCNEAKLATRNACQKSCRDMNKQGETGWDLATIPTRQHNDEVVKMVNDRYPGVKADDKFNLVWIGLKDPEVSEEYEWLDGFTDVNYFNYTRRTGNGRYGMLNKNTGDWRMKSSETYLARGLCSRAKTCWDIGSAVSGGKVTFSSPDLVEGTTAKVSCNKKCKISSKKAAKLTCKGGMWNGDDKLPTCKCKKKKKKSKKNKN